jgi:Na+-transporting methylmalonyl-CoA/oxaloacetate decarboxylase gamma subunit
MTIERILGASGKTSKTVLAIFRVIVILYGLFSIAWIIVGSVWLYTDDNCKDGKIYADFYDMWALTLAILIITYIGVGCCLFACCCILIMMCVKGKLIKKASKEEKSPDEVPAEAVRANDHAEVERKPSFERPANDDDDDVPENAV